MEKKKAIKGLILSIAYMILWGGMYYFIMQLLRNLQMLCYQKPGEMLYSTNTFAVGLLLFVFFSPFAAYYLISRLFFPKHWQNITVEIKTEFHSKAVEVLSKAVVMISIIGIAVSILYFNMFFILGKDYIVFSRPGLIQKREYSDYSKIDVVRKNWERGSIEYIFFINGKKLNASFIDAPRLITNIQNHQKQLDLEISEPRLVQSGGSTKTFLLQFIMAIIMWGGLMITMRWLMKKR